MSPSPRALDGILVLDVGSFLAGPSAATVMSGFGAEVIKVETPDGGDPNRRLGELPGLPVSEHNYSWLLDSRNKKSLAVDLMKPQGREAFLKLAARADVVTNFPPAVLTRLRLTYEEIKPLNPRLVPMAQGPFRTVSNPVSVAGQPKVPAGRAPELGEHTDEILRGLGYDAAGIAELRRLRVIAP